MAPAKKKKSPPAYILILIGPPNDVHLAPPPISVQYLNSLPGSSFSCRPFYPLIKKTRPTAHLYLNTQSTTQQNNILSLILQLKIRRFRTLSFVSLFTLFLSTVYTPPPTPLVTVALKQKKKKPSAQLSPPLKLILTIPKKKKKLTIILFILAFLK